MKEGIVEFQYLDNLLTIFSTRGINKKRQSCSSSKGCLENTHRLVSRMNCQEVEELKKGN